MLTQNDAKVLLLYLQGTSRFKYLAKNANVCVHWYSSSGYYLDNIGIPVHVEEKLWHAVVYINLWVTVVSGTLVQKDTTQMGV